MVALGHVDAEPLVQCGDEVLHVEGGAASLGDAGGATAAAARSTSSRTTLSPGPVPSTAAGSTLSSGATRHAIGDTVDAPPRKKFPTETRSGV